MKAVEVLFNPPEPLTVSELTSRIKVELESGFKSVLVAGEISNLRVVQNSGHTYFTLKDEKAQIKVVLWKRRRDYLNLKFKPSDGDQVIVRGSINVYQVQGVYQVNVEYIEQAGLGALLAAYKELEKKLATEGLFELERKRSLPLIPWTVGVVTSQDGAAFRDIRSTIERRFPGIHIILRSVKVQGEGAGLQIAEAISDLNKHGNSEVIIAGRGGGSIEELWAFNEEIVVRAIANSKIPIVSAVGHETDFTLSDQAADKRAATPTAAAEIIVPKKDDIHKQLDSHSDQIWKRMLYFIETKSQTVDDISEKLQSLIKEKIKFRKEKLFSTKRTIDMQSPEKRLSYKRGKLDRAYEDMSLRLKIILNSKKTQHMTVSASLLSKSLETYLNKQKNCLNNQLSRLKVINPTKILERGYAIVTSTDERKVYKFVGELIPGNDLKIRLQDGSRAVTVKGDKIMKQDNLFN